LLFFSLVREGDRSAEKTHIQFRLPTGGSEGSPPQVCHPGRLFLFGCCKIEHVLRNDTAIKSHFGPLEAGGWWSGKNFGDFFGQS
jgi:hypothetical protein